jgi:hypothetical protein
MKNKQETDRCANVRASPEKSTFSKQLAGVWRDLEDNQRWLYNELSPVQLLEELFLREVCERFQGPKVY